MATHRLSLVAVCGLRLLQGVRSRASGPQGLRHTGRTVPWHVQFSQARGGTRVPGIGRRIFSHWTPREAWAVGS